MLNQCNFIGRLGQDPEIRYSQGGTAFANLSVACAEKWKDKQTQEQRERTEWVKAIASGRLAEVCGEYLRKGSLVYISGKMVTRKWQDQSGQDRYTTEIRISEMKMMSPRQESSQTNTNKQPGGFNQSQRSTGFQNMQPNNNEPSNDFDDDIPF